MQYKQQKAERRRQANAVAAPTGDDCIPCCVSQTCRSAYLVEPQFTSQGAVAIASSRSKACLDGSAIHLQAYARISEAYLCHWCFVADYAVFYFYEQRWVVSHERRKRSSFEKHRPVPCMCPADLVASSCLYRVLRRLGNIDVFRECAPLPIFGCTRGRTAALALGLYIPRD